MCRDKLALVAYKWVRSSYVSAYAYAYVAGVLTCYAYVLVRTSL